MASCSKKSQCGIGTMLDVVNEEPEPTSISQNQDISTRGSDHHYSDSNTDTDSFQNSESSESDRDDESREKGMHFNN